MRILHYTLGLPPERTGGLTYYSIDLMKQQSLRNEIYLLYPGPFSPFKKNKSRFVYKKTYNKIRIYELANALPVSLLHGIREPHLFYPSNRNINAEELINFFSKINPDILHIHTIMGLPLMIIEYCKSQNIKMVYTTHDYFGLCLNGILFNKTNHSCTELNKNCVICNQDAPNILFLKLRNLKLLLRLKPFLPSIKFIQTKIFNNKTGSSNNNEDYQTLLNQYLIIFQSIDGWLYNSSISKAIFQKLVVPENFRCLPVVNNNIASSNRMIKTFSLPLQLGFIGSLEPYKGFSLLKDSLKKLITHNKTGWKLSVWGNCIGQDQEIPQITYKGKFNRDNIANVFQNIDLLIVPSVWHETFSLITLEALSYGVPVLVSQNVGAKDIINEYDPSFIVPPNENSFFEKIMDILDNPHQLLQFNTKINNIPFVFNFKEHAKQVESFYLSIYQSK